MPQSKIIMLLEVTLMPCVAIDLAQLKKIAFTINVYYRRMYVTQGAPAHAPQAPNQIHYWKNHFVGTLSFGYKCVLCSKLIVHKFLESFQIFW
jgi:hypothetical protein